MHVHSILLEDFVFLEDKIAQVLDFICDLTSQYPWCFPGYSWTCTGHEILDCLIHGSQLRSSKEVSILLSYASPHKEILRAGHIGSCIPSAGSLKQNDHCEFEISLSYIVLGQCGLQSKTPRWGERQIQVELRLKERLLKDEARRAWCRVGNASPLGPISEFESWVWNL